MPDTDRNLGKCHVCGDQMPSVDLLDHLRVLHPKPGRLERPSWPSWRS